MRTSFVSPVVAVGILASVVALGGCGSSSSGSAESSASVSTSTPSATASSASASAAVSTPTASPAASGASGVYTLAQVAEHNKQSDCWTAINGKVYNVTSWAAKHPGGDQNIYRLCGIDGTSAFSQQHGSQGEPNETLTEYQIGVLG